MPEPAVVLLNPRAAGGRAARLADPLRRWLAQQAPDVPLHIPDGIDAGHASLMDRPSGSRAVLVGGDGTLHRVLPAVLARQLSVGLVPVGSGNDLGRALGLRGVAWPEALSFALRAPALECDLGELVSDGRCIPFASSLAAGFDAAVAARAHAGPSWVRGVPRYLWATLRELASLQCWQVRVRADGATVHDGDALFASVLNTPSYGAGMPAVPHARVDDGRLDLLIAGRFGRVGTLAMLPRLLLGWHLGHPRVQTTRFAELRVDTGRAMPLAADGEPVGEAREFLVRVRPGALRIARRPVAAVGPQATKASEART